MRISDWSSDVCSSDLPARSHGEPACRPQPLSPVGASRQCAARTLRPDRRYRYRRRICDEPSWPPRRNGGGACLECNRQQRQQFSLPGTLVLLSSSQPLKGKDRKSDGEGKSVSVIEE